MYSSTTQFISSGLALVTLTATAVAYAYVRYLRNAEMMIKSVPEKDRTRLARGVLKNFDINPSNLTKRHQYELALELIRERTKRYQITSMLILFLACIMAGATAFVFFRNPDGKVSNPASSSTLITIVLSASALIISLVPLISKLLFEFISNRPSVLKSDRFIIEIKHENATGRTFEINSDDEATIKTFVEALKKLTGKDALSSEENSHEQS